MNAKAGARGMVAAFVVLLLGHTSAAQTNIALNRPASAVGFVAGTPPGLVNDGDPTSAWIHNRTSGWISIDLGAPTTVSSIRLLVEQTPAGVTKHVVSVAGADGVYRAVHTFNQQTAANTWLSHTFAPALSQVRHVRVTTEVSPSWVSWREIEVMGAATQPADCHVCYFGHYWGAGEHPGMTGNYMSEFADHSNIVHIVDSDMSRLAAKLAEARQRGMMAILAPQWVLFSEKGSLRADYRERWATYADAVEPYIDDVLAFYPVDEPLWFDNTCHHDAATRQVYETANAAIKARFPRKPIIVTFAYPCVVSGMTIPAGYDWISFDQYGTFDPIPGYLSIIKSKLRAGQKVILTADGFAAGGVPSTAAQAGWVARASQYYAMAQADPDVIGLWTFLWPSFSGGAGVRDMPPVRAEYRRIGQQILRCPRPAGACCVRADCDDADDTTRDACDVLTRRCSHTSMVADAGVADGGSADSSPVDAGIDHGADVGGSLDGPSDGDRLLPGDASTDGPRDEDPSSASGGCGCATAQLRGRVEAVPLLLLATTVALLWPRRRRVSR